MCVRVVREMARAPFTNTRYKWLFNQSFVKIKSIYLACHRVYS